MKNFSPHRNIWSKLARNYTKWNQIAKFTAVCTARRTICALIQMATLFMPANRLCWATQTINRSVACTLTKCTRTFRQKPNNPLFTKVFFLLRTQHWAYKYRHRMNKFIPTLFGKFRFYLIHLRLDFIRFRLGNTRCAQFH